MTRYFLQISLEPGQRLGPKGFAKCQQGNQVDALHDPSMLAGPVPGD